MARLKFKNQTPPRGYKYIQPDTRLQVEGENYRTLMKKVLEHRTYKGLPRATMGEVEEDVERQICSRLSSNECSAEGPNDELRPVEETHTLTLGAALRFSAAALKWLASGAKVVPVEQMKKRQAVCIDCPLNSPIRACSCSGFYKAINALVPPERRDPGLHVCGACLCSTTAKTQMPLEMVMNADEGRNISYPKLCWVTLEKDAPL